MIVEKTYIRDFVEFMNIPFTSSIKSQLIMANHICRKNTIQNVIAYALEKETFL